MGQDVPAHIFTPKTVSHTPQPLDPHFISQILNRILVDRIHSTWSWHLSVDVALQHEVLWDGEGQFGAGENVRDQG
jgi:hypothetical protein